MTRQGLNPTERIENLVRLFPCLRNAPGTDPWTAAAIDLWASSGKPSHGERCTAQFVLAVWNPDMDWRAGRFDVMEALAVWDPVHHRAFLDWVVAPWWA